MKYTISILLMLSVAISGFSKEGIKLPDLGSASDQVLSEDQERQYRNQILQQMHQYDVLVKDPIISSYVYHLGYRLAANSGKSNNDFEFFVIPYNIINASAYPGGLIVVYAGLFLETKTESELAGVLAHEIAHVNQRHISRQIVKQKNSTIPFLLGLAAALAAAQNSSSDDAGIAVAASAAAFQQQMSINFTRFNEYEADRIGIGILHASNLNPEGMAGFFSTLMQKNRIDPRFQIPEYLRTHPLSVNRVAEARSRIKSLSKTEYYESSLYDFVKERLRVLTSEESGLEHYYRQRLTENQLQSDAIRYGYALALTRANKPQKALQELSRIEPTAETAHVLNHARVSALARVDSQLALQELDKLLEKSPSNAVLMELAVNVFVQHGDLSYRDRAVRLARDLTVLDSEKPHNFELLSMASHHAVKIIQAGEAMARREHLMGRNYRAARILRNLLREDLSYYQRAEISALITEYELLITSAERKREIALESGSNRVSGFQ
ncbi:M48 family metalloprotease [Marinicella sp. W31]|uniref:M48 family metalloprotease n=1 Tax=Marinicella sp. W31 TaxID=3023713 RepID=UPI00375718F6